MSRKRRQEKSQAAAEEDEERLSVRALSAEPHQFARSSLLSAEKREKVRFELQNSRERRQSCHQKKKKKKQGRESRGKSVNKAIAIKAN